jgi:hypothetical protein
MGKICKRINELAKSLPKEVKRKLRKRVSIGTLFYLGVSLRRSSLRRAVRSTRYLLPSLMQPLVDNNALARICLAARRSGMVYFCSGAQNKRSNVQQDQLLKEPPKTQRLCYLQLIPQCSMQFA